MMTRLMTMALMVALAGCSRSAPDSATPEARDYPNPQATAESANAGQAQRDALEIDAAVLQACPEVENNKAFFDFDSAQLDSSAENVLQQLAKCLEQENMQDRKIEVVGHADPVGSEDYNKQLGRQRADAVATALTEQGLTNDRIEITSEGEQGAQANDRPNEFDRRAIIRFAQ